MFSGRAILTLLLLCSPAAAEIIDRIAFTLDNRAITESMLIEQIRLAAFYDDVQPDFSAASKRKAADTMISQLLLIREMDDTRYPDPAMTTVQEHAKGTLGRYPNDEAYRTDLANRRLTEQDVLRFLQRMLRSVEFIDLRFRRGQQVATQEVADYYEKEFTARWKAKNAGKPVPLLDQVADEIEEHILTTKTDAATEEWLTQARASAKIRFRDEVFQ